MKRVNWKETGLAALFLSPSLVVFVVFAFLPVVRTVNWGLYETTRGGAVHARVGLGHYWDVIGTDEFRRSFWHSIQFVIYTVPAGILTGQRLKFQAVGLDPVTGWFRTNCETRQF